MSEGTLAEVLTGAASWVVVEGDCSATLPTLPVVDAMVSDPPYGIGEAAGKNASRGDMAVARDYGDDEWDNAPPSTELLDLCRSRGRTQVLFGGNYFRLPPARCWLVWDKLNTGDFADCELAWTNLDRAVRRLAYRWNGMLRENNEERGQHPTQKPVGVMLWVLGLATKLDDVVLDPFCGSGTTGVACLRLGRRFIGIEREPKYAAVARERLRAEANGLTLRDARAGQLPMFGAK